MFHSVKWCKMDGDRISMCSLTLSRQRYTGWWNQWHSVHKIAYYMLASLQFRFIKLDLKMLRLECTCVCAWLLCNVLSSLGSRTLSANMWLEHKYAHFEMCITENTSTSHLFIHKVHVPTLAHTWDEFMKLKHTLIKVCSVFKITVLYSLSLSFSLSLYLHAEEGIDFNPEHKIIMKTDKMLYNCIWIVIRIFFPRLPIYFPT